MMDNLEVDQMPIGQAHRLDVDEDHAPAKYRAYILDAHTHQA